MDRKPFDCQNIPMAEGSEAPEHLPPVSGAAQELLPPDRRERQARLADTHPARVPAPGVATAEAPKNHLHLPEWVAQAALAHPGLNGLRLHPAAIPAIGLCFEASGPGA